MCKTKDNNKLTF